MDLLKGYGSDESSASSASSDHDHDGDDSNPKPPAPAARVAPPPKSKAIASVKSQTTKIRDRGGGKRLLSLGAVLPPEIFDRLTRPPEEDDSSTSSFEGGCGDGTKTGGARSKKKRKRPAVDKCNKNEHNFKIGDAGGDRTELNSLLSELRSTPLHAPTKKTTSESSGKKIDANSDASTKNDKSGKLGMAFMSYTSSATMTSKKINSEVVDVHAVKQLSARPKSAEQKKASKTAPHIAAPSSKPAFSRMSAAKPVVSTSSQRSAKYSQASSMQQHYQASVASQSHANENVEALAASKLNMAEEEQPCNDNVPKSRKQRREEERLLRSGAFQNSAAAAANTTEIHQPSPTEFAPTAHAAAIASKAARYRGAPSAGFGGGGAGSIAMYDPKSGSDVKGIGVTGKHRSKHQINQLMASAISLEAHRASEAELARFGAGGGDKGGSGSRADAKRKYGW